MVPNVFGDYLKRKRLALRRTLRVFCREQGFDSRDYSRLERGVLVPPCKEEKLAEYAGALGIELGSDAWTEFCVLASVARKEIPRNSTADGSLLGRLPVLIRPIHDSSNLDELAEKIRRS